MNPTQKLVDIDVDGILPKDREVSALSSSNINGWQENGFNLSNALHRELGVEWDIEELKRNIANGLCDCGMNDEGERIPCPICMYYQTSIDKVAQAIAAHKGVIKLVKLTP